jgi:hypothetical protein
MNASEFNTELGKLLDRAMREGVAQRKMGPIEVVGILECVKGDFIRNFQDAARAEQPARLYLPKRPGS